MAIRPVNKKPEEVKKSAKRQAREAEQKKAEGGDGPWKFEVTGGGHMVQEAWYPKGSIVESDERLDKKFANVFKMLPEDSEASNPVPINDADYNLKEHQVRSPAIAPGTEDAGSDPRADKKEVESGAADGSPVDGDDVTEAFANEVGATVTQRADGKFVVRDADGDDHDADDAEGVIETIKGFEDAETHKAKKAATKKKGKK